MVSSTSLQTASRIGCILAALLMAIPLAFPGLVSAQPVDAPIEVYRSPEFGYSFWWDANEWTIEQQAAESGSDWVQLSSGGTIVDFWGFSASGSSAESCLIQQLSEIEARPDFVSLAAAGGSGTAPSVSVSSDGLSAALNLLGTFSTAEGHATFEISESCAAIAPSDQMLITSTWFPTTIGNATAGGSDPAGSLLRTLTFPRSAWTFYRGSRFPDGPSIIGLRRPFQLLSASGEEVGIVTGFLQGCDFPNSPIVAVENTNFGNLVISPEAFVVVNDGVEVAPAVARWLSPQVDVSFSPALHAGEVAIAQLVFPVDEGELFYVDQAGASVSLGYLGECPRPDVGTSPVQIDVE